MTIEKHMSIKSCRDCPFFNSIKWFCSHPDYNDDIRELYYFGNNTYTTTASTFPSCCKLNESDTLEFYYVVDKKGTQNE
jgi:hypothetical protein